MRDFPGLGAGPPALLAANGKHLRRHPVRRSRIGAAVAIQFFLHSPATDVTKDAVLEGPRDERSEERSADAVLHAVLGRLRHYQYSQSGRQLSTRRHRDLFLLFIIDPTEKGLHQTVGILHFLRVSKIQYCLRRKTKQELYGKR